MLRKRDRCKGESVFNPFVKIAIEQAKCVANYYHLRFSHSNIYPAKSEDSTWIIALSKQPEEDTTKSPCTLFSPTVADNGDFRLIHVQSGLHVMMKDESEDLRVDDFAFSYKDWDSLVMIPKCVVFNGHNGMYLKAVLDEQDDDRQWLKFESDDGNDESSFQEECSGNNLEKHHYSYLKRPNKERR